MTKKNIVREILADVQHEIWSHWMEYLFSLCPEVEGSVMETRYIPHDLVKRWTRQMNTPYSELSEKEKDSDRDQAKKVIDTLDADGYLH